MTRKQKRQQRKRRVDWWMKHAYGYEPKKVLREYLNFYWGPGSGHGWRRVRLEDIA